MTPDRHEPWNNNSLLRVSAYRRPIILDFTEDFIFLIYEVPENQSFVEIPFYLLNTKTRFVAIIGAAIIIPPVVHFKSD